MRNLPLRGAGLSNGALIAAAERAGFEVLVTVDQNMQFQQNLTGRSISLVVIRARTTNLEDLLTVMPEVLEALESISRGSVTRVGLR